MDFPISTSDTDKYISIWIKYILDMDKVHLDMDKVHLDMDKVHLDKLCCRPNGFAGYLQKIKVLIFNKFCVPIQLTRKEPL